MTTKVIIVNTGYQPVRVYETQAALQTGRILNPGDSVAGFVYDGNDITIREDKDEPKEG